MGLGTKIKEALHGDHQTTTTSASNTTPSTGSHSTPGAFPSDDLPQRYTDGKNDTAPHDTAVDNTKSAGTHTGTTSGLMSSGHQRDRLSKGGDEYDLSHEADSRLHAGHRTQDSAIPLERGTDESHTSKGAYWGDLSKDGQRGAARDLPERTRLGQDTSASTGRHQGTAGHHHNHDHHQSHHLPDQAVGGGVYDATSAQGSHGLTNRDPTEDTHFGQGLTGTTGRHHGGSSTKGGVYNSVTGSGSPDHHDSRTSQTGTVYDPLSSGTKGIPLTSGNHSGNNYDHQTTGFQQDDISAPQRPGAGAATGVGAAAAAGYGAHEYGHHNKGNTNDSGNKTSGGVPRSSMLDPEPAFHSSSSPSGGQFTGNTGYNDAEGSQGSRFANPHHIDSGHGNRGTGAGAYSNTEGHTGHISSGPANTSTGTGSGFDSSASPTQDASSGAGRKHFGPGHEGAKVMHSCQHCGRDNDISHYFNKDVVYRLGQ